MWSLSDKRLILHWIDCVLIELRFKLKANYSTDFKKNCSMAKMFQRCRIYEKKHASRAITIILLVVSLFSTWFLSVSLFIYFIWFFVVSLTIRYPSASKDLKKQKSIDNSWTSFYIFIISFSIVFFLFHFVVYTLLPISFFDFA